MTTKQTKNDEVKQFVKERYAGLAKEQKSCCGSKGAARERAEALYSKEELAGLPEGADFSLGCGNPTALAELKPGEVVLDLGSGGGIDCFLAARRVGAEGRVIGLDMTLEMIELARQNARKMEMDNVEFRLGEMEHMPIEANSVDVVISNCVVNLSPDKDAVFSEAFRVLKPGGRFCVSDIVLLEELPRAVKESPDQWSRCVSGALPKEVYLGKIASAGFKEVAVLSEKTRIDVRSLSESAPPVEIRRTSIQVKAVKP